MENSTLLPEEAVTEFIELYKKNFGVHLDRKTGSEKANRCYRWLKLITKPTEKKLTPVNK